MDSFITVLPAQARRIVEETEKTGASVGVFQFGSILRIDTGQKFIFINAEGETLPNPMEPLSAEEEHHLRDV